MRACLTWLLAAGVFVTTGLAKAEPRYEALNLSLTKHVAVPAYERMANAMADLDAATDAFCAAPSADTLAKTTSVFHAAMGAWQRAQPIIFGPVEREGRAARIQFWPDRRGTAAKQINRALQAQKQDLLVDAGLEGRSVALQSLAAYERIIFGRGQVIAAGTASTEDLYACALAAAIARFQATLATDIVAEWRSPGGFGELIATAAAGNDHFADAEEAATAYLKSLAGTLDAAIQLKLERPLGKSIDKARPKRAENWRSARSLDNIIANLETARDLYMSPDGFGDLLSAAGAGPLDAGLRRSFDDAIETARSIGEPLSSAVTDPAVRPAVLALLEKLKDLRLLIIGPLADEIGLVVGFNALDGD